MVPRGIKYKVFTLILITNSRSWTEKKITKVCLTCFLSGPSPSISLPWSLGHWCFWNLTGDPTVWRWASCCWVFHGCVMMPQQNMFLMPEEKKIHVVNARLVKVVTWICLDFDMDLSKFWNGFVKVVIWICQGSFVYFPLPNKTKMTKTSKLVEASMLIKSRHSMSWVWCAFGKF